MWALPEVRGTYSGVQNHEIWQVTTERHSEHVQPSRSLQTHMLVKKMSHGLRMSFRILLTARPDCLPTSFSCSSARSRARVHLVLILECSWSCSRGRGRARVHRVLALECCRARARAPVLIFRRV